MNIEKWNNSEDNEFIIFIEKNIILFELNEDKNNNINLKILNKSYFPNIKNREIFHKLSKKINKFYSFKEPKEPHDENFISVY